MAHGTIIQSADGDKGTFIIIREVVLFNSTQVAVSCRSRGSKHVVIRNRSMSLC
jgi:hypothetical protein